MTRECPKCGFLQPEDRYCANCGIDMINYKPAESPWYQKLLANTLFQLVMAMVAVMVLFSLFYSESPTPLTESQETQVQTETSEPSASSSAPNANTQTQRQASQPTSQTPPASSNAGARTTPTAATDQRTQLNPPTSTQQVSKRDNNSPSKSQLTQPSPGATDSSSNNEPTVKAKTHVRVLFAEVPVTLLNRWQDSGAQGPSGATFSSLAVPTSGKLSSLNQNDLMYVNLGAATKNQMVSQTPIEKEWSYQDADGENYGIKLSLNPKSITAETTLIDVNLRVRLKSWFEGEPLELQQEVTINNDQAHIFTGLFPKQNISETEMENMSSSPLSVYTSAEFLDGLSELTLILHPE